MKDRDAAADVVAQACAKVPGLKKLYTDGAYGGKCAHAIEQTHGISVEVLRHPGNRRTGTWQDAQQPLWPEVVAKGFVLQAKRWVVERTHAWNERARRLMARHDRSSWAPLAWVWLAEARILATRLSGLNISFTPSDEPLLIGSNVADGMHRIEGVDGLRAIAMTMVVAQHCGLLPFGWTGVWLFYVISGFVITQGLLTAGDAHAPAGELYGHFLWKRLLRIVPLYLLYLLVNLAVFTPAHGGQRLGDLPYLLSFTYNWHMVFNFWPGSGGWGAFGHLWTLSVEQQFYLVFPLLALLVPDRWQTRAMLALVCTGPLLRWHWSGWLTAQGVPAGDAAFAVYAATHCHFDAFLMGALIARAQVRGIGAMALPTLATRLAAVAAVVAVVYIGFYIGTNVEVGQRGVQALRNVVSGILHGQGREVWVYVMVDLLAAALLMHVLLGRVGTAWLASRTLVWVGRVSYGGYLFHALVLWGLGQWWATPAGNRTIPERIGFFVVAWVVTVALASVSYKWFETPVAKRWRNAFTRPGPPAVARRQARA